MEICVTYSLSFLVFFFFITTSDSLLCSHDQSLALLAFKQGLFTSDRASYIDFLCSKSRGELDKPIELDWSAGTDCCSWIGITCDHTTGDVINIDLSCGRLQGTIHSNSTLFNHLPYLQILNLANNYFDGDINQKSFTNLKNLSTLRLSYNNFQGKWDLGELLSSLPNLIFLSLSNSGLSVVTDKPASYVNPGFIDLEFASCNLTVFPSFVRALESLHKLDISNNTITHLPELQLYNLKVLIVASNKIQGQLPSCICNMSNLVLMDLSNNQFGGVISQCLVSSLTHLDAKSNLFLGEFPPSILHMSKLKYLDLSDNSFSGMIPDSIGELKSLETLNLSRNIFNGSIPETIGNLVAMKLFDISRNKLTGEIPPKLNDLRSLRFFNVSENHLVGRIPPGKGLYVFDMDSFDGNPKLCGDPLPIQCELVDEEKWKFEPMPVISVIGIVIGLVLGFWIHPVPLDRRPEWLNTILEATIYKIYKQE